jgi:hypothetical protein
MSRPQYVHGVTSQKAVVFTAVRTSNLAVTVPYCCLSFGTEASNGPIAPAPDGEYGAMVEW